MNPPTRRFKNRILSSLPKNDINRISGLLTPVTLEQHKTLLDGETEHCYFVEDGIASVVVTVEDGTTVEGVPPTSFQAKVNTVLEKLGIYEEMLRELKEIGIGPADAEEIVQELHEATKHSANALQVIRRALGDVHGKKPTYTRLTYDSIKWASAICGLLEGKV